MVNIKLSLKDFDYDRHLFVIGDLPINDLISSWEKEISESPDLKDSFEIKKLEKGVFDGLLQEKSDVGAGFAEKFIERISNSQSGQEKSTLAVIEGVEEWDSLVLCQVFSEGSLLRAKKISFVITTNKLSLFSQQLKDAIFANFWSYVIGNLSDEDKDLLIKTKPLGETPTIDIESLVGEQILLILTKDGVKQPPVILS
jgi:hypothetical protein